MTISRFEIDDAREVQEMSNAVPLRQFAVTARLWGEEKDIKVTARSMLQATNDVIIERVRVTDMEQVAPAPAEGGRARFRVVVDFDGTLLTREIEADNIYQITYNISGSELEILRSRELGPAEP